MKFQLVLLPVFLLIHLILLPLLTGLMAKRSGQQFWCWFGISLLLPIVANLILMYFPGTAQQEKKIKAVENEELFDHLFISNYKRSYPSIRSPVKRHLYYQ